MVTFLASGTAGVVATIAVVGGVLALDASGTATRAGAPSRADQQAAALVSQGVIAKAPADPACPAAKIAADSSVFPTRRGYYKATLDGLARDCADLGAETILRIGVVGQGARVSGRGPGDLNVPLKLAVVDPAGKTVESRTMNAPLTLPNGTRKTSFKHLEENVSIPSSEDGYRGWKVVIGFAGGAAAASSGRRPSARATARSIVARRIARTAHATPTALRSKLRMEATTGAQAAPAARETGPGTFWGLFGSTPEQSRAYAPSLSFFGPARAPAAQP